MLSVWKGCCVGVSQRWVFAIMGFMAILNAYTMRICLSLAITEMVISSDSTSEVSDDTCPASNSTSTTASSSGTFDWDETTQGIILSAFFWGYVITHLPGGMLAGIILSAFFWGYVITHLPGGMLAERFGGKYSLGLGILSTAIFTLLTPIAVELGGAPALIAVRFLMGLGEGTTFPALNAMLAKWTPPQERSKIGSLVFAGAQIGTVVGTSLSGLLLQYSPMGWPSVFYVFGSLGVLWFIFWVVLCYNNPDEHPFISEAERKFLHEVMDSHTHKKTPPVPWRHMLRSVPVWALVAAQIGHDWGFFTMVTDLPLYMSNVLHFSIKTNGFLSALPYLCMWFVSIGSSVLADWMITAGIMSTTNIRKLGTTIASIGPGIFIIAASYAGCDRVVVVVLFTVGMALMGTFYPGMKVNALDLSPNYSGTLMALVNGIGAFTGILTPYLVGVLTPNETVAEWRLVFWIVLGVFVVTNIVYVFYASGEVQYWNDPEFLNREREELERKAAGEKALKSVCKEQERH